MTFGKKMINLHLLPLHIEAVVHVDNINKEVPPVDNLSRRVHRHHPNLLKPKLQYSGSRWVLYMMIFDALAELFTGLRKLFVDMALTLMPFNLSPVLNWTNWICVQTAMEHAAIQGLSQFIERSDALWPIGISQYNCLLAIIHSSSMSLWEIHLWNAYWPKHFAFALLLTWILFSTVFRITELPFTPHITDFPQFFHFRAAFCAVPTSVSSYHHSCMGILWIFLLFFWTFPPHSFVANINFHNIFSFIRGAMHSLIQIIQANRPLFCQIFWRCCRTFHTRAA